MKPLPDRIMDFLGTAFVVCMGILVLAFMGALVCDLWRMVLK